MIQIPHSLMDSRTSLLHSSTAQFILTAGLNQLPVALFLLVSRWTTVLLFDSLLFSTSSSNHEVVKRYSLVRVLLGPHLSPCVSLRRSVSALHLREPSRASLFKYWSSCSCSCLWFHMNVPNRFAPTSFFSPLSCLLHAAKWTQSCPCRDPGAPYDASYPPSHIMCPVA